jgi:hypothetical protein
MKKLLIALALTLPLYAHAATTTAPAATAPAADTTAAGMMANIPAFLGKLDALRGKALSVSEKAAVTSTVSQGGGVLSGIQDKFIGGLSTASGLDAGSLGAIVPSATQGVSNSDLTSKIESKMGSKLGFFQGTAVKAANSLRNNSLDGLKTTLAEGVAKKVGMDAATITGLLPMLGF